MSTTEQVNFVRTAVRRYGWRAGLVHCRRLGIPFHVALMAHAIKA